MILDSSFPLSPNLESLLCSIICGTSQAVVVKVPSCVVDVSRSGGEDEGPPGDVSGSAGHPGGQCSGFGGWEMPPTCCGPVL